MKHVIVTGKNVMSWNREKHTLRYAAQNVVHLAFMGFMWVSEQTTIISLCSINWLVFVTEAECVYCAVRTEYYIWLRSYLKNKHEKTDDFCFKECSDGHRGAVDRKAPSLFYHQRHDYHHHLAHKQLGHLLTPTGLRHQEVSLMVSPGFVCDFFCIFFIFFDNNVDEAFCLYVATNFCCIHH